MVYSVNLDSFVNLPARMGTYKMKPLIQIDFQTEWKLKREIEKAVRVLDCFYSQSSLVLYLTADSFYEVLGYEAYDSETGQFKGVAVSVDTGSEINYLEINQK